MQLVNGSIFVWICGVGKSIREILFNYSRRIFGAQWVTSLQHGSLSSHLIGQNGFLGSQALLAKRLKYKTFQYRLLQHSANKMRNVAWKSSALISQNLSSNFSTSRFERLLQERPYKAMQNRYRDNFWRREYYSNELETFLTFVA